MMRKALIFLCIVITSFNYTLADDTHPTIAAVGEQRVCISKQEYDFEVKINLNSYKLSEIDSFVVQWGYPDYKDTKNGGIKVIKKNEFNIINSIFLKFKLPDIFSACIPEQEGDVRLDTYRAGIGKNSRFSPTFLIPPRAEINKDSALTICATETFYFDGSESCPSNIISHEWVIDGKSYNGASISVRFDTPGEKKAKLTVTNECGSDSKEIKINVQKLPEAIAEAKADIEDGHYVICLNDKEKGKIELDGSKSKNADKYRWTQTSYGGSANIVNPNQKKTEVKFTAAGIYKFKLEASMPCNYPDYDSVIVEVMDRIPVNLTEVYDSCGPIQYIPPTNQEGTIYTIEKGNTKLGEYSQSQFPITLGEGNYTVRAKYQNRCGETSDKVEFKVREPKNTKITEPSNNYIVCKGASKVDLKGNQSSGRFEGDHVDKSIIGNNYTFNPKQVGIYTIKYSTGSGSCLRQDSIKIQVIDNTPFTLDEQPDVCQSLSYKPYPYFTDAVYKIDGTVVNSFPKQLTPGKYKVEGVLSNACGKDQKVVDEFEVTIPQNVTITAPSKDITLCLGEDSIELKGSNSKGVFSTSYSDLIAYQGNKWFFNPSRVGTHKVTFEEGIGLCKTSASVNIKVIERQVLTLNKQADVCGSLNYSIKPNNVSGAKYTINDEPITGSKTLGVGKYFVVGTFEDACGIQEVRDTFEVKNVHQVNITSPQTGDIFCLDQGEIEIKVSDFGGAFTPNQNISTKSNKYYFKPTQKNDYTIKYTYGEGQGCSTSDEIKIKVIDENPLQLNPQEDVCNSVNYKPQPFLSFATYKINGTVYPENQFPIVLNGAKQYIVEAEFENECGKSTKRDTFNVTVAQDVHFIDYTDAVTFCKADGKQEIKVSVPGGEFSDTPGFFKENGKFYFDPHVSGLGDFNLSYKQGIGSCSREAKLKITVIESIPLELPKQEDVCDFIDYRPGSFSPNAIYTVNGVEADFNGGKTHRIEGEKEVIVTAYMKNECGELTLRDSFNVTVAQDVYFIDYTDAVTFCKADGKQEIKVSVPGGEFSDTPGFLEENGKFYFDPHVSGLGDFNLSYNQGIGSCSREAKLKITVIESIPLQLPDQEDVCNSIEYTPKGFSPDATYKLNGKEISNDDFPITISEAGLYIIEAEMTNECGTLTLSDTFELFVPMDVKITNPEKDLTLCISEEKLKITGSTERGNFVPIDELTIIKSDEAELDISKPGIFKVVFEQGFGDCYTSDTLIVNVEDAKVLELNHQGNACETLEYTPEPFSTEVEYKINGKVESNFPIILNKGKYEIVATLVDACTTHVKEDSFEVYPKDSLKIISDKDDRVCVNSDAILLTSTIPGAVFEGEHLRYENEQLFFDPIEAGLFNIKLELPLANCIQKDDKTIEVIGLAPKIEDVDVCQEITKIILNGEPEGGIWSSTTCSDCIQGNVFTFNGIDTVYQYTYTLTNDIGCVAEDHAVINIISPTSDFELNTAPCSSGIDFDLSRSVGDEYIWLIDGVATGTQPPFIGLETGEHKITMIAHLGDCFDTSSVSVFIIDPVDNAADFSLPEKEHCTPYTLIPNIHTPYYDYLDYKWTISFDNDLIVYDTYDIAGGVELINNHPYRKTAVVKYEAGNVCGMVEVIDSMEIIGIPQSIIGIDSSRYGCSPYTIAISNIAQGEIESCVWRINGKVVSTSCDPYFYHTFTAKDTTTKHIIEFETSNECGHDIAFDTITVTPPGIDVFFNTDVFEVCQNSPVTFEDATTPNPIYWRWDFGDGHFSDDQNPTHTYRKSGQFDVKLIASTGCGYDSISRPITVKPAPSADFILPVYSCQNQLSDSIKNLSDYRHNKFVWDFGNNILDSIHAHPRPIYDDYGSFDVTLKVMDKDNGCINSVTKSYEVKPQPQIDILLDSIICYGKELKIPNNTLYANGYTWYYDTLPVHQGKDPVIVIDKTGEHYIKMVADFNEKCVDSVTKVVVVKRCDVYIPNLFTPNNDGKDDFFTAYGGINTSLIRSMQIFDRWGELVFSKNNFPLNVDYYGWDGSVKTRSKTHGLNSAVFIYMIEVEFTDGTTERFAGDVTLIR